jgi:hypothetical protein
VPPLRAFAFSAPRERYRCWPGGAAFGPGGFSPETTASTPRAATQIPNKARVAKKIQRRLFMQHPAWRGSGVFVGGVDKIGAEGGLEIINVVKVCTAV